MNRLIGTLLLISCSMSAVCQSSWPPEPLTTARVSEGSNGEQAPDGGGIARVSGTGRFVFFAASFPDPDNPTQFIEGLYVKDRMTGVLSLGSRNSAGEPASLNAMSGRVARPIGISDDGNILLFQTNAANMGYTVPPPLAATMAQLYFRNRLTGQTIRLQVPTPTCPFCWWSGDADLSGDGTKAVALWMTESAPLMVHGFIFDLATQTHELVTVNSTGVPANAPIPGIDLAHDGGSIAFHTGASNFGPQPVDPTSFNVVVKNLQTEVAQIASSTTEGIVVSKSVNGAVSNGGRYVAFQSFSTNLIPNMGNGSYQIYVKDLVSGTVWLASRGVDGAIANSSTMEPTISADGMRVAFRSYATNLSPMDANGGLTDVFLYERGSSSAQLISVSSAGVQGSLMNGELYQNPPPLPYLMQNSPVISADGRSVAYHADSPNLVPDDTNQATDVFVRNLAGTPIPPSSAIAVPTGSLLSQMLLFAGLLTLGWHVRLKVQRQGTASVVSR